MVRLTIALITGLVAAAGTASAAQAAVPPGSVTEEMAVDAAGRTTVAWIHGADGEYVVQAVRFGADGTAGEVVDIGPWAYDPDRHEGPLRVATDSQGRSVISFRDQLVRIDAGGAVERLDLGFEVHAIAIDSSDRVTAVGFAYGDPNLPPNLVAVRVGADGVVGPYRTISQGFASAPDAVIDSQDRATVAWFDSAGVQTARLEADGNLGQKHTVSSARQAGAPEIAVDSQDRVVIAWADQFGDRAVHSVRLAADGAPGPERTLAGDQPFVRAMRVAADSQGRSTVFWARPDEGTIQAIRLAPDGSPGARRAVAVGLAEVGTGYGTDTFDVAVDAQDRLTLVWETRDRGVAATRIGADEGLGFTNTIASPAVRPVVGTGPGAAVRVAWIRPRTPEFLGAAGAVQTALLDPNGVAGPVQSLSPLDTAPPVLSGGSGAYRQGEFDWYVRLDADEYSLVKLTGRIRASGNGRRPRAFELTPASSPSVHELPQGPVSGVYLRISVATRKPAFINKLIRRFKRVRAKVTFTATDYSGNAATDTAKLRLRLPRE